MSHAAPVSFRERSAQRALALYKFFGPLYSHFFPGQCRYLPTCSEYAAQSIAVHGAARGLLMALWRLARCHPFAAGGLDPVRPQKPAQILREPELEMSSASGLSIPQ